MEKLPKIDWLTKSLIIVASAIMVILAFKYFRSDVSVPKHQEIKNWTKLADQSSLIEGDVNAAVKVIDFFSYGCGFCRVLHHSLVKLHNEFPAEVSIYYKPVHMGRYGFDYVTAIAAYCANRQNNFIAANKLLFEYDGTFPNWGDFAKKIEISNSFQFTQCVRDKSTSFRVQNDEKIADSLKLRGVPYIIINGKGFLGSLSYPQIKTIVQKELEK